MGNDSVKFDYNNIPEKTKLVHALDYKKIVGEAKDVDLKDPKLKDKMTQLGWQMVKTCVTDNGLGCSAPQLGISNKVFVMVDFEKLGIWRFAGTHSLFMNPTITPIPKAERIKAPEVCLSAPGEKFLVARPGEIEVSYWYFSDSGKLLQSTHEKLVGYPARIFQRQYDLLYGTPIVRLHERQNVTSKPKKLGRPKGSKNSKKS